MSGDADSADETLATVSVKKESPGGSSNTGSAAERNKKLSKTTMHPGLKSNPHGQSQD